VSLPHNLYQHNRPLFEHLPDRQHGPAFNLFLRPVREGLTTDPAEIVNHVVARLRQDLQRRGWGDMASYLMDRRKVLLAILAHPTEALALAQEAVAYHQLPPHVVAERKAARDAEGRRRYMASQPPTDKQVWYLRKLGVDTIPENRLHASELIDAQVRKGVARA
jgi:hypothetical protein